MRVEKQKETSCIVNNLTASSGQNLVSTGKGEYSVFRLLGSCSKAFRMIIYSRKIRRIGVLQVH
jgi:hypothetical protein